MRRVLWHGRGCLVLWILVQCGGRVARSLEPRGAPESFSTQVWSTDNGLPQNSVHALAQTRDGYLWFGTEGGLARFDGYQFRVFDRQNTPGLDGDDVGSLLEDRSGALWVGTASGLTRLKDGKAQTFGVADGVPAGAIRTMLQTADGRLWVVTSGGLAAVVDNVDSAKIRFRIFSSSDGLVGSVLSMVADPRGGVWIGTSLGLVHVSGSRIEPGLAAVTGTSIDAVANVPGEADALLISSSKGLLRQQNGVVTILAKPALLPSGGVRILLATREGVWALGRNSVSLVRPQGTIRLATGKELPGTQVTAIAEDRQGVVWIGTNGGTARFRNGLAETGDGDSDAVLALLEDREGDMWVGTDTAGVKVLRPRVFELQRGSTDGASTSVLQTRDGALWTGTNGTGLTHIDALGGASRTYTTKDGLASDTVLALGASGAQLDDLWVGTPDGLSVLHRGRWRTITSDDGLGDDLVRSLLVARDGTVWMGTRRGVTRWKDGHGVTLTSAQGLGSDLAGPMLEDANGDLWIGTSGGLSRVHSGAVRNYTVADGLPSNIITTLEASGKGGFWVGTEGEGLAKWDGSKFFSFASFPGLPRNIYASLEDGSGTLWLSSDHRIIRVSVEALEKFQADRKTELEAVSYGPADGLPPIATGGDGYPSATKLLDGRMAFASRRGVVVFDPERLSQTEAPPAVVVEQVAVDDRIVTPEELSSLAPGPTHFSFSFAGISFAAPQRVQYRYLLEGLDRNWIDAGTRRIAYYTNIPHGKYRFLVEARIAGETWSPAAAMPLVLRPYFYQRVWFRALCAVLLLGLAAGLYWMRLRALHGRFDAVAAERERLAREIHDTLAQSFVAVSVRLEVMAQMLRTAAGVEAAREQLEQTRTLVRGGLEEARRSIWDLRAEGPEAQTLPARLARLVREQMPGNPDIRLQTTGTYRALTRAVEDELHRIAQEGLANAVRHASAQTIWLRLTYELDWISLEVDDDGKGFDVSMAPSRELGHFGLSGMRERARILGAEVMLESAPGKGTSVRVSLPLTCEHEPKRKRSSSA